MQEIDINPVSPNRLTALLPDVRADRFRQVARRARVLLDGRVVWNVSSTAHGGGVAEMLQTLVAHARGVGVDARWLVLSGSPDFFAVTKRVHNLLHGDVGDGGELSKREYAVVAHALSPNLDQMRSRVRPGDIVLLHDPQTAGLVEGLRRAGARVVWRCHVGRDEPNAQTDLAWRFLEPFIEAAEAFVFSRARYAPGWMDPQRLRVITPSIDPFSAKNCPLTETEVQSTLRRAGLVGTDGDAVTSEFTRRDGTHGLVRRRHNLVLDGPPPPTTARLVVQVSRWDRLKDMAGVLTGFGDAIPTLPSDVHLMLVGPVVDGVTDDPEGADVLAECRDLWRGLDPARQERVHLVGLPMDDVGENAHLVNALQRRATVVVQKSLVEGFGLTVTEAMWKGRPVLASAVGAIQDQIVDGRSGVLLRDPRDLVTFAAQLRALLHDPDRASMLGAGGRERVQAGFLADRHLEDYTDLFTGLLG